LPRPGAPAEEPPYEPVEGPEPVGAGRHEDPDGWPRPYDPEREVVGPGVPGGVDAEGRAVGGRGAGGGAGGRGGGGGGRPAGRGRAGGVVWVRVDRAAGFVKPRARAGVPCG